MSDALHIVCLRVNHNDISVLVDFWASSPVSAVFQPWRYSGAAGKLLVSLAPWAQRIS